LAGDTIKAARPAVETNARLAQLAAEAKGDISNAGASSVQTAYTRVLMFRGFMLDARIVVTYFCMRGLFMYLIVSIREDSKCILHAKDTYRHASGSQRQSSLYSKFLPLL